MIYMVYNYGENYNIVGNEIFAYNDISYYNFIYLYFIL